MIRTFKQHHLRQTQLLDGQWAFAADPGRVGHERGWALSFPETHQSMFVPSCWNNEWELYDYEGVAWYHTPFTLNQGGPIRLLFHGVMGDAEIYVDGQLTGSHYGGFTAFEVVIPGLAAGVHQLVVRTDNQHTHQTIPLERVDWFHYGGIIRSVELQELPDVYLDKWKIGYDLNIQGRNANVKVTGLLQSLGQHEAHVPLALSCNQERVEACHYVVPAGGTTEISFEFQMDDVRLWELDDPNLYYFQVSTGQDDWIERTGFRKVEVKDRKVLLNGEAVYFKGVNRHEEHPEWGFAFPPKLMKKDLDITIHMGCNAVRGSHYPNSQYWLDLLDEHGMIFWSEIPLWQYQTSHMTDSVVQQRAVHMLEEMIEESYHHPSILFWSVNNECATETEEGLAFNRRLVQRVRALDESRLVTFATDRPLSDITLSLFDVIGINQYFGWYGGKVEQFEAFLQEYKAYAEKMASAEKPVIMAEFGGAGIFGDVGWEENRMFSEDYQSAILESALGIFRNDEQVCGTFIWQFSDVRSDTLRFRDRARGFNNKGIVNEYRKPKLAYRTVKRIYDSWEAGEKEIEA